MSILRITTFTPYAESRMIFTARSITIMRDRVDSREGVYKRANRRLSCHLEWTNSSLESLTPLPVRLSIARIVISGSSPRLLLRSHRLSILSSPPCPSFIRASLPSPRFARISFYGFALTLSLSLRIYASATIDARFELYFPFFKSSFIDRYIFLYKIIAFLRYIK